MNSIGRPLRSKKNLCMITKRISKPDRPYFMQVTFKSTKLTRVPELMLRPPGGPTRTCCRTSPSWVSDTQVPPSPVAKEV